MNAAAHREFKDRLFEQFARIGKALASPKRLEILVYLSLIAAVSDASSSSWRARSLSVYRFWRDLGYAMGALSAGLIADAFGLPWAIVSAGVLTFLSGGVVATSMREGFEDHNGTKRGATRT